MEHKSTCCKWIIFAGFMVVSESERGERGFGLENESGEGVLCVVRESGREK